VLAFFNIIWNDDEIDYTKIASQVLSNKDFWDCDLTRIDGLSESVSNALKNIIEKGVVDAIRSYNV